MDSNPIKRVARMLDMRRNTSSLLSVNTTQIRRTTTESNVLSKDASCRVCIQCQTLSIADGLQQEVEGEEMLSPCQR